MIAPFQFIKPENSKELLQQISELEQKRVKYILSSGSTDLMPQLKQGAVQTEVLVSLTGISEFKGIEEIEVANQTFVQIGSQETLRDFAKNELIGLNFPALSLAAQRIASPQIQNRATVGGNLLVNNRCSYYNQSELNREVHSGCYKAGGDICHMVPSAKPGKLPLCRARFVSDLAPVLLVLDAKVILLSSSGERVIELSDFYLADGIDRNQLKHGEVIAKVLIPVNSAKKVAYEKLRIRNAIDFPSLGVALGISKDSSWKVEASVTGINTYPIYKSQTGSDLESLVKLLADECTKEAVPMRQDFFPPAYRKKMISVLIGKLYRELKGKV